MNRQEAIQSMRNLDDVISITESEHEAVKLAIKALEKQIPNKPDREDESEPWKQYIRERQITIIDDHCVCGMAIDNGWEFCPKCGRQIKGRGYSIPKNRPLTKGDVIRESNESLAKFIEQQFADERIYIHGDVDDIEDYLNQPQEDTNE